MNIGIFTDTYYPLVNGVVTSTLLLEKELTRLGHKVYVFTTTNPNDKSKSPRLFRLPSMPFVFLPSQRVTILYSPKLLLNLGKFDLDIIHTQTEFPVGIFGRMVAEFHKVPTVHTYHTMYEDYVHYIANGHLITKSMARRFSRIFCNRARAVIAPTQKTRDVLNQYGVKRPIVILPTGIDFEPFERSSYDEEELQQLKDGFGIQKQDKVILFIGRLAKEKSIDVIIRQMPHIVKKSPHVKFLIVGDGPVKNSLVNLSKELAVYEHIVFAGEQPWRTIGKFYQLGDVFISASTTETQGLTYIEAMASRLPVIAKQDPSIENIIENGETGFTFESGEELPAIVYEVLANPNRTATIVNHAYENIASLSSKQFALNVEALYEDVIAHYTKRKENHR